MNKKTTLILAAGMAAAIQTIHAVEKAPSATPETRLDAVEEKIDLIEWARNIQIKGDMRYRYEFKAVSGTTKTSNNRIRARIGAYADVNDQIKTGFRLATGNSRKPTAANQDMDKYTTQKNIWIDLGYIEYQSTDIDGLGATFGKMKRPWAEASNLMFDGDINPEGATASYNTKTDALSISSDLGYFTMSENGRGNDTALIAAQLAATADLNENIKLSCGIGLFSYQNIASSEIPAYKENGAPEPKGNSSIDNLGTNYVYGYDLIDSFLKLEINEGPAPVKVYGQYVRNVADDVKEDTAWVLGLGTSYKKLSLDYNFRDVEADAVVGYFTDGDHGGTDTISHVVKAKYKLFKNTTFGLAYYAHEDRGGNEVNVINVDLAAKF